MIQLDGYVYWINLDTTTRPYRWSVLKCDSKINAYRLNMIDGIPDCVEVLASDLTHEQATNFLKLLR